MGTKEEENESRISFEVKKDYESLEKYLKKEYRISTKLIKKMVKEKSIYLNDIKVRRYVEIKSGDVITLEMMEETTEVLPDIDVSIDIVYENKDIIALNKQPFIPSHTTRAYPMGTISNGVADYFLEKNIRKKIRLINRLDKDTSGIMLVGKNPFAHQQIGRQFQEDTVTKTYIAVVNGVVLEDYGKIDMPIGESDDAECIKRVVRDDGKEAITEFKVVRRYKDSTILKLKLVTGRTHQLRVHLSHIGHPILGDKLYFKESEYINRQALHSHSVEIELPREREKIILKAEIADDIKYLINQLEE